MTNREMIESALKRVNALLGRNIKLYRDNTGWFIIEKGLVLTQSSMPAGELLAYLHGVEDGLSYRKTQLEDIQRKVDEEMRDKVHDHQVRKVDASEEVSVNWED